MRGHVPMFVWCFWPFEKPECVRIFISSSFCYGITRTDHINITAFSVPPLLPANFHFPFNFPNRKNVFLRNSVYFAWLLVIFFSCFCLSYGNVFFIACAFHFVFISKGNATTFWRPANFILFISVQPKVNMRKKNKTEAALKIRTMKMPNSLWNVIF